MIQNKSDSCFNCGEALKNEENFCPNCGQINTDLNISVSSLIKEFASDYFSFDSKLFKTLWPLITKPGHVPKEYIDGLRVRHIPPLRMFLFLSFISFFLWGLSFHINPINKKEKGPFLMLDSLNRNISNNQAFIDSINLENGLDIQLTEDSSINSINSTSL